MIKDGYYINENGITIEICAIQDILDLECINIVEIKCNSELKMLRCSNNPLIKLTLNNKLNELICYNTKLNELFLFHNLKSLHADINTKLINFNKNTNINLK